MTLKKNTSNVLLHLLNGCTNSAELYRKMEGSITVRSLQRSLTTLTEGGVVDRHGPSNNPSYTVNHGKMLNLAVPTAVLENPDRPESKLNHDFIAWLSSNSAKELASAVRATRKHDKKLVKSKLTKKELEHLTIELSWKSSALEGNTYTLLDTELLLTEGVKAANKTDFETQMILNHKEAVSFIMNNTELFLGRIKFSTIEEMHRLISYNLGIGQGVRKRIVRITASNYQPISNPHQIREAADEFLSVVSNQKDPFVRALLAFSFFPYLQAFEDGNKRTGRMLANAILISMVGQGFSLRRIDAKELALAYLAFYEFNSVKGLSRILQAELW